MVGYEGLTLYEDQRLRSIQSAYVKSGVPLPVFKQAYRKRALNGNLRPLTYKEFRLQSGGLFGSKSGGQKAASEALTFSDELEALGYGVQERPFCWSDGRILIQWLHGHWIVSGKGSVLIFATNCGRDCCNFLLKREYMRLNGIQPKPASKADLIWLDLIVTA